MRLKDNLKDGVVTAVGDDIDDRANIFWDKAFDSGLFPEVTWTKEQSELANLLVNNLISGIRRKYDGVISVRDEFDEKAKEIIDESWLSSGGTNRYLSSQMLERLIAQALRDAQPKWPTHDEIASVAKDGVAWAIAKMKGEI